MGRTLQRSLSLLVALVLLSGALPASTVHPSDRTVGLSSAVLPRRPLPLSTPSFSPVTFDDFNRTVSSGWGTSSTGVDWTDDSFRQNGVTSQQAGNAMSVDGLNGRMDLGVQEPVFMRAGSGPWQQPEWTMTARFEVGTVPGAGDDLKVSLWVFTDSPLPYGDGPHVDLDVSSNTSGGFQGKVSLGGTPGADPNLVSIPKADWQANVSYTLKWGLTWGGQSKIKIWPSADPEPATWLLIRDGSGDRVTTGASTVLEPMAGFADIPTQVWFDDLHFDPGNLPVEPPPPGMEQQENSATGADPVQTFSGSLQYHRTDASIPGRGPAISFARSYNSADTRVGPLGPGWTHSYNSRLANPGDGTGDLMLVRPDGNTDRFTANQDGSFSAPPAVYSTLAKNADGSYTATEKDQSSQTFNEGGQLIAIADRFGNASTLTYDSSNRLTGITDPAGRGSLTLGYTNARLTSVTDWASPARTVTYQYDTSGRLWKVTDREGKTTTFAYDGTSARMATITDARIHVALTLTYDAQRRVATQKDARGLTTGDVTTLAYVVNGDGTRVTTITEPVTSFESSFHPTVEDTYDANGWLTQRVSKPSSTETLTQTYAYDATGNRTAVTDPRGNRTDYCYDTSYAGAALGSRGNLTRKIAPSPTVGANRPVTLLAYDAKDNVIQSVAPKGVPSGATVSCATNLSAISTAYATDLTYDASGIKLLSATSRFTDPDTGLKTATTKYEYADAANPGRVTKVIPPRGNTSGSPDYTYATSLTYFTTGSKVGLLSGVTDALGNTATFDYDAVGRLVAKVDANGNAAGGVPADHTTNYVYDKEDRIRFLKLPAPIAGGAQVVTETRYDEVGNPIVRIDANGQVMTDAYDERDGLFQVKESPNAWTDPATPPAGVITTEYAYDAAGNLTRMTRAKGDAANERATDYLFDGRGLVRRETQYPSWPATTPTLVSANSYDPNGNLATVVDPLNHTTSSGYDAFSRLSSLDYSDPGTPDLAYGYDANGNRISMTDGTGATSYVYDEANRLTSVASPGPKTVGYRYDLDGNRTKVIYPDSTAVTYTFNKASQLASLSDWASRSVAYTYWPDGLVKTATNPDTSVATYSYDNARRSTDILSQVGSTTITHHAYTLDPVGNVTGLAEFVSGLTQGPTDWSASTRVNADDGVNEIFPVLAIGTDDTAYAAWIRGWLGPESDIYFSLRNPTTGTWAAQQRVNNVTAGNQFDPDIGVDGSGNAYAVWTDESVADRNIFFSKRSASTGTWSASVRVNDDPTNKTPEQRMPAIAVRSTGEAIAVWLDKRGGKDNIYAARLPAGGSTWSANMKITTNTTTTKALPDVAFGPDGTAYAVWYEPASGDANIWFSTLPPGSSTWSANTKISDDPGTAFQGAPQIAVDGAGNVTVVWQDWRTTPFQLRARRRPAGSSTWSPSVVITSDGGNEPSLSVRSDGRAVVAWYDGVNSSTPVTWASEYDPAAGTWSARQRISDPSATDSNATAAAAIGASGMVVAWQNTHSLPGGGQDTDIYAKTKSFAGGGTDTFTYGYDRLSRLTSVTGADGNPTYGYDPVGNRTSKVLSGTTNYTYDRADRITAAGALSVTVNANGNTAAKGADTFTYDQANRLKTATVGGATETYFYDGNGIRFSRQIGTGTPIRYVSDINRRLPVTIDDGTRKYVYGLGLAYAVSGTAIEVYHTDRVGSVRAISDATGAVTASYRSDEWGVPTASNGSSTQPFRFTGEPQDSTGFTYLRARYYDASLGRFMSRDVVRGDLGSSQSLNRQAYSLNDPVSYSDPTGRKSQSLLENGGVHTVGGCLVSTVNAVLLYWSSATCGITDESGNRAILIINGSGFGPGLGASVGPGVLVSNGRSVTDQAGPFSDSATATGYPGIGVGVTSARGTNSSGQQIDTAIGTLGPGVGFPSITWGSSYTTVITDPDLIYLYQQLFSGH